MVIPSSIQAAKQGIQVAKTTWQGLNPITQGAITGGAFSGGVDLARQGYNSYNCECNDFSLTSSGIAIGSGALGGTVGGAWSQGMLKTASATGGKVAEKVSPINLHQNLDNATGIVIMMNSMVIGATTNKVLNSVLNSKRKHQDK